jgi:hypothetical protein
MFSTTHRQLLDPSLQPAIRRSQAIHAQELGLGEKSDHRSHPVRIIGGIEASRVSTSAIATTAAGSIS